MKKWNIRWNRREVKRDFSISHFRISQREARRDLTLTCRIVHHRSWTVGVKANNIKFTFNESMSAPLKEVENFTFFCLFSSVQLTSLSSRRRLASSSDDVFFSAIFRSFARYTSGWMDKLLMEEVKATAHRRCIGWIRTTRNFHKPQSWTKIRRLSASGWRWKWQFAHQQAEIQHFPLHSSSMI